MIPLVAIVGPTGVGKSAISVYLATRFGGEVINADSRQVYRHMDIGTAKPPISQREQVRHHLVDIVDPREEFSLALYLSLAGAAVQEIHGRGVLPILVGGTGQYVWGFLEGWRVPHVPPQKELRSQLEEKAKKEGIDTIYQQLQDVDPIAAANIGPRNLRRLVRALEVYYTTSQPFSQARRKEPPDYSIFTLGLTLSRKELYRRIDERVETMVAGGWVEEVRRLMAMGCSLDLSSMSSVGYREIGQYLQGQMSLEEAVQRIKTRTHRFARHQYAWFHLADPRIHWLQNDEGVNIHAETLVSEFLRNRDESYDRMKVGTGS